MGLEHGAFSLPGATNTVKKQNKYTLGTCQLNPEEGVVKNPGGIELAFKEQITFGLGQVWEEGNRIYSSQGKVL